MFHTETKIQSYIKAETAKNQENLAYTSPIELILSMCGYGFVISLLCITIIVYLVTTFNFTHPKCLRK